VSFPGRGMFAGILLLLAGVAVADDFPGVSVTPPATGAWVQVQRTARSLVWMRRTDIENVSLGVALLTQPLERAYASRDEFIDWVRRTKEANPDPSRFRLVSNEMKPADGALDTCVRYATVVEDAAAGGGPGGLLKLEVTGLACRHPGDSARYFDIQYSTRMPVDNTLPGELLGEARAFLDSVNFLAPPADGDWSLGEGTSEHPRREAT
jgi:hypothetical protein